MHIIELNRMAIIFPLTNFVKHNKHRIFCNVKAKLKFYTNFLKK